MKDIKYEKCTRKTFAKIDDSIEMPNLIKVQKDSYDWFVEEGLGEILKDISPIVDYSGNLVLEFLDYYMEEKTKYTLEEAKERDPTRKAIVKGKTPKVKKIKYLNQFELHTLIAHLDIKEEPNWDWFILLVSKTGMRFSEALAITPADFDFARQTLSVSKTWDYKGDGGFLPTKNKSSVRKIQIDWQIVVKFSELVKNLPEDKPIFVGEEKIYNSTVNDVLARHCKECGISVISIHGLRHTHASLLLFAGVSIASVARRLGHASMTTTQKTYLHIIQELENKDVDLVMRTLSGL